MLTRLEAGAIAMPALFSRKTELSVNAFSKEHFQIFHSLYYIFLFCKVVLSVNLGRTDIFIIFSFIIMVIQVR